EANRALDTMARRADSLGLDEVVSKITALQALGSSGPEETGEASNERVAPLAEGADQEAVDLDDRTALGRLPRPAERVPVEGYPEGGIRVLSARVGELDVVVLYREAVNYALVHNRVSPVAAVKLVNNGDESVTDVTLTVELDTPPALADTPVASPLEIRVGTVEGLASLDIPAHRLSWRLNPAPFVTLDEAILSGIHLTVSVGSEAHGDIVRDSSDIRLLTAEEWWALSIPESLAAFVRPNDPAVLDLLRDASELLEQRTGSPALEG